jgi:hypothetical protein
MNSATTHRIFTFVGSLLVSAICLAAEPAKQATPNAALDIYARRPNSSTSVVDGG